MIGDRQQQARFQSDFYRDHYYKILRFLFVSIAIMLVLIGVIIYYVFLNPPIHYYATSISGQIIPMVRTG